MHHHTHDGRPTPSSGPPPFTGTTDRCYIASKSLFEQKGIILRLVHRPAFIEGDLERNFGSKCLPGLLHHRFMFFHVSNYTNQSASLESASCLRRKRDYVVAPEFIGGPTSLPTGNRAPSGAVIFSRISKMLLECFFATKTLNTHAREITAPERGSVPGRKAGRPLGLLGCLVRRDVIPLAT